MSGPTYYSYVVSSPIMTSAFGPVHRNPPSVRMEAGAAVTAPTPIVPHFDVSEANGLLADRQKEWAKKYTAEQLTAPTLRPGDVKPPPRPSYEKKGWW